MLILAEIFIIFIKFSTLYKEASAIFLDNVLFVFSKIHIGSLRS